MSDWSLQAADLTIKEAALAMSIVRLREPSASVLIGLSAALGLDWPAVPNTSAIGGARTVHWLAPNEWAVFGMDSAELHRTVDAVCASSLYHVAEVGEGHRIWRLAGARVRAFLAKGCSLDLHPRAFGRERCAQTLFAQIRVLIAWSDAQEEELELVADAALEYQAEAV